jgi:hypothetical protein
MADGMTMTAMAVPMPIGQQLPTTFYYTTHFPIHLFIS